MTPVCFSLNGVPFCETGGNRIVTVRSHRIWALVGFLALQKGTWVHRSEVAEALWPGQASDRAKQNLRQTLLLCSQTFGPVIKSDRQSLLLDPSVCDCDIWQSKVALNFLENLSDEWIDDARPHFLNAVYDIPERITDPSLNLILKLRGSEFDQTLTNLFQVWMALGTYDEPIKVLGSRQVAGTLTCRGYAILTLLYAYKGHFTQAQSVLNGVEKFQESAEDPYCLYAAGLLHHFNFRLNISSQFLRQAIQHATIRDPFIMFASASSLCSLTERTEALRIADKYAAMAEEHGFEELACLLHLYMASDRIEQGKNQAALRKLDKVKAILTEPGRPGNTAQTLARLGRLYERLGKKGTARECYETSLEQAKLTDGLQKLAEVMTYLADLSVEQGDLHQALSYHGECISIRRDIDHRWGLATSLRGAGFASLQLGMYRQAEGHLKESLKCYEGMGDNLGCASVLMPLAKLFAARHQNERALRCALAAKKLIDDQDSAALERDVPPIFVSHASVNAFISSITAA